MDIVIHGGAGDVGRASACRQATLDEAAARGASAETPIEAVERAINRLERSPRFNAGRGGAVQSDGVIRTDAGIMTAEGAVGAAGAMPGVARAITVARLVMTETPHILLAGERAVAFAEAHEVPTGVDLWTDRRRRQWSADRPPDGGPREQLAWIRDRFGGTTGRPDADVVERGETGSGSCSEAGGPTDTDTVGAVATDGRTIVAGTSTGGRWLALAGRVGDVPQVGSGFYCSPAGGASVTGAGEAIAKRTLARSVVDRLENGADPPSVAEGAIDRFEAATGETAGIIVADAEGHIGTAATTTDMQTSRISR